LSDDLSTIREVIDGIDADIAQLINARGVAARAALKARNLRGDPSGHDYDREIQIVQNYKKRLIASSSDIADLVVAILAVTNPCL
jgi:chorismate mutase